ncbi:RNA-binding domain-containing protein [Pirellulaceae bacterium SH449]
MPVLPINVKDLLHRRTIEGERVEFKAGWNPVAIVRTLCAFANDFENLGGGYVVIGQDCDADGNPIFPPCGLDRGELDKIQREMQRLGNLFQPSYFPHLGIVEYEGKTLLILWAPGGPNRPYKAPADVTSKHKEYRYFIRRYASTITVAENSDEMRELLSLTATVPFDDRYCPRAELTDLKLPLIESFLKEIGSELAASAAEIPFVDLCRQMNLIEGGSEYLKPRNVGLLFFSPDPHKFFPGATIDVVIFPDGAGGDEIIEKTFRGPIHEQIRSALRYIDNEVLVEKVRKVPDRAEADRFWNYPRVAIEEALVNAVYHRGYDAPEPIEVRVNPESIEMVSYPGPEPSIRNEQLQSGRVVPRRYRNRRIGELLKELELTERRGTGFPKIERAMQRNGSPPAVFSTDEGRTHFLVTLPIHPEMRGVIRKAGAVSKASTHTVWIDEQAQKVGHEISDRQRALMRILLDHRQLSLGDILERLSGTHAPRTIQRELQRLRDAGLVESTGVGKGAKWSICRR